MPPLPELPAQPDLLAEAQRLARPVTLLKTSGTGTPVACWGGEPTVPLPAHLVVTDEDDLEDGYFFTHWLSVDARHLPRPLPGCLSVFLHGDRSPLVLHDPEAVLQCTEEGAPLYGHPVLERPHLDALFRHASPAVQAWVAQQLGEDPEVLRTRSDVGAPRQSTLEQLDQVLRSDHPMWTRGVVAQLGGWCWGWPDEAWDEREQAGQELMVVTYEQSEPWVEVWWTGERFEGVEHIT